MELHHHPAEKKKFKEYLLEGVMIFIAVTMGFFAESLREHIGDNHKEKEYIHSLMADLKQDTLAFNYTITQNNIKLHWLDSLLSLADKDLSNPHNSELLYRYANNGVSRYNAFGSNDATMAQLKSSGGLQYIRQGHVADSIAGYDQEVRSVYVSEQAYLKAVNDGMDAMSRTLVFSTLKNTTFYKNGKFTGKTLPLLNTDRKTVIQFFNRISLERGWTENYLRNLREHSPAATKLMALLKKEYDLDE